MTNKNSIAACIALSILLCMIVPFNTDAQSAAVSGKITDKKGAPLAKATVTLKGTGTSTAANEDGSFELRNVPASGELVISFVGFTTREIKYTAGKKLDITLEETSGETDEIIVTGVFDKRKKLESSVAITTLTTKDIDRMAPVSAADLLKNIPGVYVNQARGEIWNTVYSRDISQSAEPSV